MLRSSQLFIELLSTKDKYAVKLSVTELIKISRKLRKRYNGRLWKMWFERCVRLFLLHLKLLLTGIQWSRYLHLRELLKVISKLVTVWCARKIHWQYWLCGRYMLHFTHALRIIAYNEDSESLCFKCPCSRAWILCFLYEKYATLTTYFQYDEFSCHYINYNNNNNSLFHSLWAIIEIEMGT